MVRVAAINPRPPLPYAAFGKKINPHLFRACLATSTAIHHGAQIGLAMTVLDHKSPEVMHRYYIKAEMIDAVRAYQEILLADPHD